jgi:hypothetical protein
MRRQEYLHDLWISPSASDRGIAASNSSVEEVSFAHLRVMSFLSMAESLLPFPGLQLSMLLKMVKLDGEKLRPMTQRPLSATEAYFYRHTQHVQSV